MSKGLLATLARSPKERRVNFRFSCAIQAVCRPFSDDVEDISWLVQICDISRGGVKLLAARRFESGTVLNINTEIASLGAVTALIAKVIHVSPHQAGRWNLGCHFAKNISSRELITFLPKTT